jgi:hypothetical protein
MDPLRRFPRNSAAAVLCAVCAFAVEYQAGTDLPIRLKTKVSTQTAKAGDPIEAVVIGGPLMGAVARGTVVKAVPSTKGDERSTLSLRFAEMESGGKQVKIEARIAEVENAREQVDAEGVIQGILASETITGKLDQGIARVADKYAELAGILGSIKGTVFKAAENGIAYDAGVELTLRLTAPVDLEPPPGPKLQPVSDTTELEKLIAAEPFQTIAENPPKPSDVTNLLLVGTEEQIRKTFAEAGWSTAAALSANSKMETVKAIGENRGYSEAPVSILLLDGKPPDLVFQKSTNTFAKRHHLRVWKRAATYEGKPVWSVAATHDIGINFSEKNRTFIHLIDGQIDRERTKVAEDLMFTGKVQSFLLLERPQVPKKSENATGDALETDGKIAVLIWATMDADKKPN